MDMEDLNMLWTICIVAVAGMVAARVALKIISKKRASRSNETDETY